MNIVFIIVDCMRWDMMSGNGYPRPTTPNMDRIADRACVFDRVYASVNQTDQSLTSIFSGVYPITHGLERTAATTPRPELLSLNAWRLRYLPQMLKACGFVTWGIDWLDRWHQWGYDWYWGRDKRGGRGIFRYAATRAAARFPGVAQSVAGLMKAHSTTLGKLITTKPGIGAEAATEQALRVLRQNRDQPLFLMLHYWDVHAPYGSRGEQYLDQMRKTVLPGEDRDVRGLVGELCHSSQYKHWALNSVARDATTTGELVTQHCASLRYVDRQIGRIFEFVERNQLLDQTLFVITSDHGENLFEHGYFVEHSGVHENVMHVPFILHVPGFGPSRINQAASHVDIVPTLMDHLGLREDTPFDGLSLMPLLAKGISLERDYVYFQSRASEPDPRWGIVGERYKYVESRQTDAVPCLYCGKSHAAPVELYDLIADPEEQKNLAESRPDISEQLSASLQQLVAHLAEKNAQISSAAGEALEILYSDSDQAKLNERLRSLGYID